MKLLFKWDTYEIYYKKEVIRFVLLMMTFLMIAFVGIYVKPLHHFIRLILVIIAFYIPFMWVWSLNRMTEISDNKKKSIAIQKIDYDKINKAYLNCKFLIYKNKKYIECNSINFENEEIILLRINNIYFRKKDIKKNTK